MAEQIALYAAVAPVAMVVMVDTAEVMDTLRIRLRQVPHLIEAAAAGLVAEVPAAA